MVVNRVDEVEVVYEDIYVCCVVFGEVEVYLNGLKQCIGHFGVQRSL